MTTYKVTVDFIGQFVGTVSSADDDGRMTMEQIRSKLHTLFDDALVNLDVVPPYPWELEITEANSVGATVVLKEA